MKKFLTLAVLFLAGAAQADQNWVRVIVEPNWNLGDNSPGPGSGGMYTVYYAPTNGWGNTAEEILPKLKLFSPKEFDEKFTKLEAPAATYSRNDQQYTFTGYGATIDPTKAYFTVILCKDEAKYGYYYRVIDSHLSNYDQFLSGEPNEKCSAHLSFGYFYHIDIAYAFKTVTDEAGEETYISYMTDWDQGKLEQTWDFVPGEPRTFSTAEFATQAAAKFNANPREWIKIPTGLENADETTLTNYGNMFVATASDNTVSLSLKEEAKASIQASATSAQSAAFAALLCETNSATFTGAVPGVYYAARYIVQEGETVVTNTTAAVLATGTQVTLPCLETIAPKQFDFFVVASVQTITSETVVDGNVSFASAVEKFKLGVDGAACASAEMAEIAAAAINKNRTTMITAPDGLNAADAETYCEMFKAAASGARVVISFTPKARDDVQVSLTGAMTTVFKAFVEQSGEVVITNVVPGVYYAVKYGTDENLGTKTTPVLATNTCVTLMVPEDSKPNPAKFAFRVWASLTTDDVSSAGGVQLWEDGPYWAQSNVGANTEDEVGYYFWWGDTIGYKAVGGTKLMGKYLSKPTWESSAGATMSTSPFGSSTTALTSGKDQATLLTEDYIDSTGNLAPAHDAATVHLGAPWRMPTSDEYAALTINCDCEWTTRNEVKGLLLKGRGDYASKSIFLPFAGRASGSMVYYPWTTGYYWSSTFSAIDSNGNSSSNCSRYLLFDTSSYRTDVYDRSSGFPVRPLKDAVAFTSNVMKWSSEDGTECVSESQAQEIAAIIEANRSAAIAVPEGLSETDGADYRNLFGIAPIGTKVTIDLTSAAKQEIRDSVEAAASLLFPVFFNESPSEVQLTCAVPGIYYDIKYGVDASFGATTPSVRATSTQLSLTVPKSDETTKFAFRVRASVKPLETCDATVVTDGVQLWEDGPYWSEVNMDGNTFGPYPLNSAWCWWGDTGAYVKGVGKWYSASGDGRTITFAPETTEIMTYNQDFRELQATGYVDSVGNLVDTHDVATVHLGASWRMPRDVDFQALRDNCTLTFTKMNYRGQSDVNGWRVTGKGDYNAKSIFLPACDEAIGDGSDVLVYKNAHYWSSTVSSNSSTCARSLFLSSGAPETSGVVDAERWKGQSMRAVKDVVFASRVMQCPVKPNQYDCATEEQAQQVAATITNDLRNAIAIPDALANATEEALSTYCNLYGATVSGTTVVIDLTPAATNDIQKTVDDAQTNVLAAVLWDADKAKIIAIPGIYYAIEYGEDLGLGANTPGTMATGFTVDLDKPRLESPSGFFKVIASPKPIEKKE